MIRSRFENIAKRLRLERLLLSEPGSAEIAQRIQVTQLNGWIRISFVTVPVGLAIAFMLCVAYWDRRGDRLLQLSLAGLVAGYFVLLRLCLAWVRSKTGRYDVLARMRRLLGARFVLGVSWGIGLVGMMAVSTAEERSLVYAIAVGLMSTSVFGGPVPYALSFWLPLTVGAFACLFVGGTLLGLAPLLCLIAYSMLTFCAILYFDRQLVERSINTMRLERHAETISILLRDFEESSSDWLWESDATLTLRHVSPRFAEVAQRSPQEMEVSLVELLGGDVAEEAVPPDRAVAALRQRIEARLPFRELVVPVRLGVERRWWAMTGKPLFDSEGHFTGYRGVGADVTAAHRSRERIAYLARHDTLTDLSNRAGFNDAFAAALAECRRQPFALLCLDLDEFKSINDSYGHDVGDAVLRAVAQRVRGVLRTQDVAARLGGDEFAVLLDVLDRDHAAGAAQRIIGSLSAPFACGDVVIRIGVSIGIALAPEDGDDPDVLYRNADLALYRAKSAGRGTWRLFDPNMDRLLHERRLLQRDMREALPKGELFVAYQPIVDLSTRELIGLEALVRWRHPERGIVPPAEFVPIAEQSGQIGAIGSFVLSEAAALASRLPPPLRIAVNLSPLQLRDEGLVMRVRNVLDRFALPPERIEFEITESVMMDPGGRSLETLRELRNCGHRLAIDDFGTGYSSLSVLRDFPFHRLKIDRSFIADLDSDAGDGPIVRAVIGLGRALGISVTAEGVESERQARILQNYRCASAQGYYFSRPLTPGQVLALVAPAKGAAPRGRVTLPAPIEPPAEEPSEDAGKRRWSAMVAGR